MKIRSFEEAKQCMDDLREFLDFADSAISGISVLKGAALNSNSTCLVSEKPASKPKGAEPDGWTDGVRKLFQFADKPLRPVELLERWIASGWSYPPNRRTFYIGVNGGLQYLLKKGFLEKSDGKYKLKNQEQ